MPKVCGHITCPPQLDKIRLQIQHESDRRSQLEKISCSRLNIMMSDEHHDSMYVKILFSVSSVQIWVGYVCSKLLCASSHSDASHTTALNDRYGLSTLKTNRFWTAGGKNELVSVCPRLKALFLKAGDLQTFLCYLSNWFLSSCLSLVYDFTLWPATRQPVSNSVLTKRLF